MFHTSKSISCSTTSTASFMSNHTASPAALKNCGYDSKHEDIFYPRGVLAVDRLMCMARPLVSGRIIIKDSERPGRQI